MPNKLKRGRNVALLFLRRFEMKHIISLFLSVALLFCSSVRSFAANSNIDTGGGGLGGGSSGNIWYGDSGVRVTVVDAETRTAVSNSIDLIKPPEYALAWYSDNIIHFGKVCKTTYSAGAGLSPVVGGYNYILPSQELPKIIATNSGTGSIEQIRNYFCDENVLRGISGYLSFNYDTMISGDYKLVIEPLSAFVYRGGAYVMTATEAALYDRQVNGDLRAKMAPLTHQNLPLAIFLETADLGYPAWSGGRSGRVDNEQIISSLGIGVVRFTEMPDEPEPTTFDYEYRTDTDVIASVQVSGGQSDPDNPVSVEFNIEGTTYTVSNVYYPEGDSQLVWVKWHTPSEPCVCTIRVQTVGGGSTRSVITANIVDLDGNDPPNPTANDRNDAFTLASVPTNPQKTYASWGIWSPWWQENWVWVPVWEKCWHSSWVPDGNDGGYTDWWYHWVDNGYWEDQGWWELDWNGYSAALSANMKITPDSLSPTSSASVLKSGYGIQQKITAQISSSQSSAVTAAQNAVTHFPEFDYENYWRLLDCAVVGNRSTLSFKNNPYSTYDRPTHFTPIWFPDGNYTPYTWLIDCWTPTGMLSMNLTDTVTISSDLWEDWHIAPAK